MHGSSEQGLQLTFDRCSVACDQEGTKICSIETDVLCLAKAVFSGLTPKSVFPASEHKYTAASRAGLKGRGARGNFYCRAPMTYFNASSFVKITFALTRNVHRLLFPVVEKCLLNCTYS